MLNSKASLIRYMCHELRTPLNSIDLGLKLLVSHIEAASTSTGNDRLLELIDTASDAESSLACAVRLLDSLRSLENITSGALVLQRADVPIVPLVNEVARTFLLQADDAGVELRFLAGDTDANNIDSGRNNLYVYNNATQSHDDLHSHE
jgi:signal transduction histidine kinase